MALSVEELAGDNTGQPVLVSEQERSETIMPAVDESSNAVITQAENNFSDDRIDMPSDTEKQQQASAAESPLPDPEARPGVFSSTWSECVCILCLSFAPIMNSANQGALQLALPYVSESFNINGGQLSWTVTSYSLVTGATMLIMARLSDIIGRKRALLAAFAWYALLSLIEGFMKTAIVFDVMRGLQALGGATGPAAAVGIIGVIYPASQRKNRALATFAAGAPLGFIAGIVAAGICIQFLSWRAVLFFLAIIYACLTVILYFLIPSDEVCAEWTNKGIIARGGTDLVVIERDWKKSLLLLKNLDFIGVFLSLAGLILFIFALSESSSAPDGWKTPYVIALIIVGVVLIGIFIFWESRAPNPLMPLFIWRYPSFALVMGILVCGWMNFQGVLIYFASLTFQHIDKYSALHTTAAMLPQAVSGILVNVVAAFTLHIISGKILMIIAMASFFIASLLWALNPIHLTYWAMKFPALAIVVIGADLGYNVGNQYSLSAVPPQFKSTAAGIFNVMTQLAASIGVAASTAIVTAKIGSDIENQAPEILHRGYRDAYWFAVGISSVGLILSFFLKVGTQGGKGAQDNGELLQKSDTDPSIDGNEEEEPQIPSTPLDYLETESKHSRPTSISDHASGLPISERHLQEKTAQE
ncbi:major facilitator superfamily-domain-containing protein [Lipomyces oligophaga]|uniref:major facilitator superfamily-domain-containing protein n=1 Tax=Lipomyces oligophaga TaxID=45792 RepID=UPI0034CD5973